MILLGVAISIAVVVLVGFYVSKRIEGDSSNFLVGGRMLPFWLVGGALMGSAVDTNATPGKHRSGIRVRLLGRGQPAAGPGAVFDEHRRLLRQTDEPDGADLVSGLLPDAVRPASTRPSRPSSMASRSWQAGPSRSPFKPAPLLPRAR